MVNRVIAHLRGRTPYVLHRLDSPTSGVLLFAKSVLVARDVQRQFRERLAEKAYLAVLLGTPARDTFTVDMPIASHPGDKSLSLVVPRAGGAEDEDGGGEEGGVPLGKESLTYFEVIERGSAASACLVRPRTGRMHQIRVHAEYEGHPLAGDTQYGKEKQALHAPGCSRLLLHAHSLRIRHPGGEAPDGGGGGGGDGGFLRFTAPPPDAFVQQAALLGVGRAVEELQIRGAFAEWEEEEQ